LLAKHKAEDRLMTVAASARQQYIDFGVLEVNDGFIKGFHEKPSIPYNVSMGIYCLSRRILPEIPALQPFGFDQLVLKMLAAGKPLRAEFHFGYWLDIGRPDDYQSNRGVATLKTSWVSDARSGRSSGDEILAGVDTVLVTGLRFVGRHLVIA
jgi:NDP-sugar pyrophosphorylase family protein